MTDLVSQLSILRRIPAGTDRATVGIMWKGRAVSLTFFRRGDEWVSEDAVPAEFPREVRVRLP